MLFAQDFNTSVCDFWGIATFSFFTLYVNLHPVFPKLLVGKAVVPRIALACASLV